jgi:hypothetical protein
MNYFPQFAVIASMLLPVLFAIGVWQAYRKWQDRGGKRSPIEGKVIHGAGEQLRKRIEDHTDELMFSLITLQFIGPLLFALWAATKINWSQVHFLYADLLYVAAFVGFGAWSMKRVLKFGDLRRRGREGLRAELFTAQELNRLIGSGCIVLHELPAEGFNIDHVVIGPRAVYAIETKSVREPKPSGSGGHFKVQYDGTMLRFPHSVGKASLVQAQRQADWLRRYLSQSLDTAVPVTPALSLPGWWIDSTRDMPVDAVRVFNPSGKGALFMAEQRGKSMIQPQLLPLISQALIMRYPATQS